MIFPNNYINEVVEEIGKTVSLRSNIKCMEDINDWVSKFGELNFTRFNCRSSIPNGKRIKCSKKFVCQHSNFKKTNTNIKGLTKNANFPATIDIKIKLSTTATKKKDPFIKKGLMGCIKIYNNHTHRINTAESLRYLPANNEVKNLFYEYFDNGMGIAEAQKYHEQLLELKDDFKLEILANGSINPCNRTIRHWHDVWRNLNLGPRTGDGLLEKIKEKQRVYKDNGTTVLFKENPFSIIIVTPIMKRAHHLNLAKEIIFVDSTSACDPSNHAITFIMCPSAAGAVPLAVIVTKGQTYESYCQGFSLLKEAVPESFCGQGYPNIFITDQSSAEINAINSIWPRSSTLLCVFHVLQAVWRWLWDSKHNIPLEKRKILMKEFRTVLYSESIADAEHAYSKSIEDNDDYPNWIIYIQNYWSYRQKWCLCFRDHTSRGHITNNYCEVAVRLFKDHVLCRVKAYNVLALIDLTCTALEDYYKRRLRQFSDSRNASSRLFLQKMMKKTTYLKKEMIIQENDYEFLVPSEEESSLMYYVDTKSGLCSCSAALTGKFCKHQCAVYKYFGVVSEYCPVITPVDRFNIAKIAYGEKVLDESFYEPFIKENCSINKDEIVTIKKIENNKNRIIEENISSTSSNGNNEKNITEENRLSSSAIENVLKIMSNCNEKFGSSSSGILKLEERLKKIKSEGQWETFLHTAGQQVSLRRRDSAMIKVQPTSIARRSAKVTKGSKRLLAGRPPLGEKTKVKKKRNLGLNINLNQTNAKSHEHF